MSVTSHAEVWIETGQMLGGHGIIGSPPTRRCGLKHRVYIMILHVIDVTSHAEVWIETCRIVLNINKKNVTSHAEVWIETSLVCASKMAFWRHLPRGGVD